MLRMQDKKESFKEKKTLVNVRCPCDEPCVRHGKCLVCQDYHREHPECGKTACGK
jgi:hypothetical protein